MELDAIGVKRKWLRCWKVLVGYQILVGVLFLTIGILWEWRGEEGIGAGAAVFFSLWGMFWLFLCRKCAYEKPGTKLLTCILVLSGLGVLKRFFGLAKSDFDLYELIELVIFVFIFIWFVITSLNLRKLNKKIRRENKKIELETVNPTASK